jgi:hypothetical protein
VGALVHTVNRHRSAGVNLERPRGPTAHGDFTIFSALYRCFSAPVFGLTDENARLTPINITILSILLVVLDGLWLAAPASWQGAISHVNAASSQFRRRTQRLIRVGDVHYSGEHTWQGVIEVGSDNLLFKNGRISAGPAIAGVPQGVSFIGDRRNITLRNLQFEGVGDGVNIGYDQLIDDFFIDRCSFLNCRAPDVDSEDVLSSSRGYGMFGGSGSNWTIKSSIFQTKCMPAAAPVDARATHDDTAACDFSVQYAMRLGNVHGLNVIDSKFENHNGKPAVWLMFVHDAVFERCEFSGGRVLVGVRPGDMGGVEMGDSRNIVFRDCTFNFGTFDDSAAFMHIYPGSESIRFENCTFTTEGEQFWLEVDSRNTADVRWDNCTWNGEPIEGYAGVRWSESHEEMVARGIGPVSDYSAPSRSDAAR